MLLVVIWDHIIWENPIGVYFYTSPSKVTVNAQRMKMTWLVGFFSCVVILSWLLPTKETERLLLRRSCFSKDSANSWMEFVSGHELSAEGVLLAFLWQWHLTSWSSWSSLEPLRWPEDEPLAEAWNRVVWREESVAWKTKRLCWLLNSKAEHTRQIFFLPQTLSQTVVQSEGPSPEFCIFLFKENHTAKNLLSGGSSSRISYYSWVWGYKFWHTVNISSVKCAGSS